MTSRSDSSRITFFSRYSKFLAGAAVAFGLLVLTGWALHVHQLKALAAQITVKANAAVCFILVGIALWLATRARETSTLRKAISAGLALAAAAIGLLSLLEYAFRWDFGIDQFLFVSRPEDLPGSVRSGLMAPIAAADFCLLGVATALTLTNKPWMRRCVQALAGIAAILSVFGMLDMALDPGTSHTHIAPNTALVLFLFSFGVIFCRPENDLPRLLASSTVGGVVARILLPASIFIPILIGWLRWRGEIAGLFSEWTGLSLMIVAVILLVSGLTLWAAFTIQHSDLERGRAEASTRALASIVHASSDAIIGKNLEGVITSWNHGAEAMYGYTADEMIGRPMILAMPLDRVEEFKDMLERVGRGEHIRQYESARVRKDGSTMDVWISMSPVQDEAGRIVGSSSVSRDITDRRKAETQIRALNQELEQRVEQRTAELRQANSALTTAVKDLESFSYSVSHDLRAPLRHISGFAKILMEEFAPQLPPEASHYLQRINEGTHRMGMLVDDLLNLARVGRCNLALQVTGLASVVEEVIGGLSLEIGDRKIDWKIGPLPFVECDPTLIKQVFQNLLSNAVKFTRPRTQAVIEIGQKAESTPPVIYVRDNGVGFSMKYADKLFGVFQRLHRPEDFEGTGVGLATVQRVIHKHGGDIWAEAELDRGATFYFALAHSKIIESKPNDEPAASTGTVPPLVQNSPQTSSQKDLGVCKA